MKNSNRGENETSGRTGPKNKKKKPIVQNKTTFDFLNPNDNYTYNTKLEHT